MRDNFWVGELNQKWTLKKTSMYNSALAKSVILL